MSNSSGIAQNHLARSFLVKIFIIDDNKAAREHVSKVVGSSIRSADSVIACDSRSALRYEQFNTADLVFVRASSLMENPQISAMTAGLEIRMVVMHDVASSEEPSYHHIPGLVFHMERPVNDSKVRTAISFLHHEIAPQDNLAVA